MSQETQHDTILKQFHQLNEKMQSPTVPESEKQMVLIQMQSLMNKYSVLMGAQSEKLKELQNHVNSIVEKMR